MILVCRRQKILNFLLKPVGRLCVCRALPPRCGPHHRHLGWVSRVQLPRGVPRRPPGALCAAVGEEGRRNGRPKTLFYFSRTYVIDWHHLVLGTPQNYIKILTPSQCCTHICLLHRMSPRFDMRPIRPVEFLFNDSMSHAVLSRRREWWLLTVSW
jgi:hypothetical protein